MEKIGELCNITLIPRNILDYFSSLLEAMIKSKLDNWENAVRDFAWSEFATTINFYFNPHSCYAILLKTQ